MPQRPRLTSVAVDEALEARLATQALVEAVNAAIGDGVINAIEAATLDRLAGRALTENVDATRASQRADAHAWAIHALECGQLDTEYLRAQAADMGYDPDALNALVAERETTAA